MAKKIQPQFVHDFIGGGIRPNPDYRPAPKFPNPTTELTRKVIDYVCRQPQCFAGRTPVTGKYRPDAGQFVGAGACVGWPDITATVFGRFVGIEIKRGNDTQRSAQKTIEAKIEATGGAYLIVSDFDQFKTLFDEYVAKKLKQLQK